jgi:hypothetical protein
VPRRELDALGRKQIEKWIVTRRNRVTHSRNDTLVLMRPGDCEHSGIGRRDFLRFRTHAAGHDHLAILLEGLPNGCKRFRLGAVKKPAGVDEDHIRAAMVASELVAFRAEPRDDALAVDQRLGAAKRDEAHLGGGGIRNEISGCHGRSS